MSKSLLAVEYGSLIAGLSLVDIQQILSTLLLAISVIVGIINLFIMIKKALSDGKIDDKEYEEILKAQQELIDKLNTNKDKDKDGDNDHDSNGRLT